MGAVSAARKTPQLPTLWPEVYKPREGFGTRELEAQLGRGGLVMYFRSFLESEFGMKVDRT